MKNLKNEISALESKISASESTVYFRVALEVKKHNKNSVITDARKGAEDLVEGILGKDFKKVKVGFVSDLGKYQGDYVLEFFAKGPSGLIKKVSKGIKGSVIG